MDQGTELQTFTSNGNNGASYLSNEQVTASNGDGLAYRTSGGTERDTLLSGQATGRNGHSDHDAEAPGNMANAYTSPETSNVGRIKRELTEVVFWRIRLWMVILFILFLVIVVIIISLAVCSAIHEDADEEFDPSSFKAPLYFNGSFQLPNAVFTLSSNESQALAADLQEKLADLYKASPALGRYFSRAEIHSLRKGSVIADYQLTFLMPEEQQDQLRNFTLSREMVYNVLRQFLYDQEPHSSGPTYIDPLSLSMF